MQILRLCAMHVAHTTNTQTLISHPHPSLHMSTHSPLLTHTRTHTCTHTHTHAHTHTCTHTHTHAHTHTYTHTHTHTHMRACTHAHTLTHSVSVVSFCSSHLAHQTTKPFFLPLHLVCSISTHTFSSTLIADT